MLVLAFTQATGINSVLNYSVKVFQQAGLEGTTANWADFTIKVVNCLMTIVAMVLVDRKGRKFLLKIGTAGIVVGLLGTGFLFNNVEKARKDGKPLFDGYVNLVGPGSTIRKSMPNGATSCATDSTNPSIPHLVA